MPILFSSISLIYGRSWVIVCVMDGRREGGMTDWKEVKVKRGNKGKKARKMEGK